MNINQFLTNFSDQFEDPNNLKIDMNTNYKQLETWDSLTSFSIQSMIEDEYGVIVSPSDIKICETVLDLFKLIESKK